MEFAWDREKANANFVKHGVSFEEAEWAFQDAHAVELFDELNSNEELRYQIIALSPRRLLFVAFTLNEATIRIISARKANARQVKIYHEYNR